MGFSANGCCTSSAESVVSRDFYGESEFSDHEVRFQSVLHKMVWDFGFGCVIPRRHRRSFSRNNKAWLLAESGGCGADEPKSVHSSFRFSFCSQVELESMAVLRGGCSSSATVLMVNLDGGVLTESKSSEWRGRRAELLERTINPLSHSLTRFTYPQILKATRNFSQDRVVGRGALSCVFRGRVGYMKASFAIKRLNKEDKESSKAFCRELMVASSLHNPHIVPLVGFCIHSDGALFLVYKYVSGGSLEHFLHEKKRGVGGSPSLPWPTRYKIAIGIAEAIEYLHHGTDRCIVHRDMKPSNILLSSKRTPKLCDFGLATWTSAPSLPFLCKTVKGTFGYLAPEYFQHGKVSDRTDVYAFGVVLLELITGRKPIESRSGPQEENLVSWSKPLLQLGRFENLLDPQLRITPKNTDEIARMARAAAACLNNESQRPDIGGITPILRGDEARKRGLLRVNSSIGESQRAKREMRSHFTLAMLGVEFEDDDDLFSR